MTGLFFSSFLLQAQHHYRGLLLENDRYDNLPLPLTYGKVEQLPAIASVKEFMPRVVTQASTNTAVVWSVVWYANTIVEAKLKNIKSSDPAHRRLPLAPAFIYREITPKEGCEEPVSIINALNAMTEGAPRFAEFPELCANSIPDQIREVAPANKLAGYVRLFNSFDPRNTKVHAIKKALHSGSPVVLGMICPPSFQFAREFWQPRELDPLNEYGGHTVCVVGYDDTKFGGAFEVVNSWGLDWGDRGLTWLRYDDFTSFALYGFQLLNAGHPLEASITLNTGDGKPMPVQKKSEGMYAVSQTYKTGDSFNMAIRTRGGLFSAIIVEDASKQRAMLFPADTSLTSFIPSIHFLPNESSYFTLTEPAGKNILYFVFSDRESDLKNLTRNVLNTGATPPINSNALKWWDDAVHFESQQPSIVVKVELSQE